MGGREILAASNPRRCEKYAVGREGLVVWAG